MDTYYDDISDGYEELHKEEQLKKARIILGHLKINKKDKLLDVGCGTGFYLEMFECEVMGVDPSEGLLKHNKFPHEKASAEKLLFEDNSFDIVISVTAIHNFSDIEQGLLEIKRVGSGQFAFSILKSSPNWETIDDMIKKHFTVKKIVMEDKDIIYLCK